MTTPNPASQFGLPAVQQCAYFDSLAAVAEQAPPGQAHHMRRAFEDIGVDGVLCVDRVPTVYFKRIRGALDRQTANQVQRQVWNQGTALVLVLRDDRNLYIFAAQGMPDQSDGEVRDHPSFVQRLNWTAAVLEREHFVERVASGAYYRQRDDKFRPGSSVDRHLIDCLGKLCEELAEGKGEGCRRAVNAFVGRLVFLCYLIDRGIIQLADYPQIRPGIRSLPDLFERMGGDPHELHRTLFGLFDAVKEDFNGSMFDDSIALERQLVAAADMTVLGMFLSGHDLPHRQLTLPFYTYDFSIIPVETISAIYEQLLGWENAQSKKDAGAFYTPRHLAEMVVEEATRDFSTLLDKRFLDPSCGSGVFLVTIFNRMADEWRQQHPDLVADNAAKFEALTRLLRQNLCGIDVNATACRIACFSLYVALLDQLAPRYLRALQNRRQQFLPELLENLGTGGSRLPRATILNGDFFHLAANGGGPAFDVVLGNPPWVGRLGTGSSGIETAWDWTVDKERNPWLERCGVMALRRKAERTKLTKAAFLPGRQIAHAFMWKTALHLSSGGRGCLLLPSAVLLNNNTGDFQRHWLRQVSLERVIQLADYRRVLFEGAKNPCVMVHFREGQPGAREHTFEHVAPKFIRADTRSGRIPVRPDDRERVHLEDVLLVAGKGSPTSFWKQLQRSTSRERRFLRFLADCPQLTDHISAHGGDARWNKGVGFKPDYPVKDYGNPKPLPWPLDETRFVRAKELPDCPVLLPADCVSLRDGPMGMRTRVNKEAHAASMTTLNRLPPERLFTPPLLLFNQGFTKFAFADFPVVFRDSLRCISADGDDRDTLAFLVACLWSPLARFLQFHTSSTLATERRRVNLDEEFLSFPFPLPGWAHIRRDAGGIVREVAGRIMKLKADIEARYEREGAGELALAAESAGEYRARRVAKLRPELNRMVYKYFNLTDEEIALVEDTCEIYLPSATPERYDKDIPTLRPTNAAQRIEYADWLCRTLNRWAREAQPAGKAPPFFFTAETAPLDTLGQVMVTLTKGGKETAVREADNAAPGVEEALGRLAALASTQNGPFEYLYGTIAVDGDFIRILKPDLLGEWTRTAALNDAAEIFGAIVEAKGDE